MKAADSERWATIEGGRRKAPKASTEKTLARRAGVRDVKILSAADKVEVRYDARKVQADELADSIAALGYKVQAADVPPAPLVDERRAFRGEVVRFGFVAVVAAIALLEIGGEYFGWLAVAKERIPLAVLLAAILIGGYPIFRRAVLGALKGRINVDSMMSVGIIGAAAIGQYTSSMLIVFFMGIAHFLEEFTTGKSCKAIRELIKPTPKTARIKRDGREIEVAVDALQPGDVVAIRPGEQIPADGSVVAGTGAVNQASITGESMPVDKQAGDPVFAATFNDAGYLEVRVIRVGARTPPSARSSSSSKRPKRSRRRCKSSSTASPPIFCPRPSASRPSPISSPASSPTRSRCWSPPAPAPWASPRRFRSSRAWAAAPSAACSSKAGFTLRRSRAWTAS